MGTDDCGSNHIDAGRHVYGPRPVGALVPGLTRAAFKKRAPSAVQVMTDWANIVGPALAEVTSPRRLSSGTLTLACTGPIALELQHMAGELMARINGYLGRIVVERLRFVQDAAPVAAAIPARARRPAPRVTIPGLPQGELQDALAALGRALLSNDEA